MTDFKDDILEKYLGNYREQIAVEQVDEASVSLSFPFHFASHHRIELTVSKIANGQFVITDMARTIGELKASGYSVTAELKERLIALAKVKGLRTTANYLLMDSTGKTLGDDLQRFLEAAKTIGDVYFVHKAKPMTEKDLVRKVKQVLNERQVVYQEKFKLGGEIDQHTFDFYVPPNGIPGLAVSVVGAQNTHNAAQVWGFKCDDIKRQPQNKKLRIGIVYDTTHSSWSEESRRILESRADIVLSDNQVPELARALVKH